MKPVAIFSLLLLMPAGFGQACQVPVFRFALERWEADQFHLYVLHQEPISPSLQKKLQALDAELLTQPPPANLQIESIDVSKISEAERLSIPGMERVETYPSFLLQAPATWNVNEPAWLAPASAEALDLMLDSPARQRCAEHLLGGASVVWLLIESGAEEADNKALAQLQEGLAKTEESIALPEGVMRPDEVGQAEGEVDLDDVLRSPIPLKIAFEIVRIRRDDPAESIFLQMLAGPAGFPGSGPMVVPVFGRGRTMGLLPASRLGTDGIVAASTYLCGTCSCQVKSGNPGYDLLFHAAWHEHLRHGLVVVEKELPPLPSTGDLFPEQPPEIPRPSPAAPAPENHFSLKGYVAAGLLAFLVIGSLIVFRKRGA